MKPHQRILQWQADHPTTTWIIWGIIWLIVFFLFYRPQAVGAV